MKTGGNGEGYRVHFSKLIGMRVKSLHLEAAMAGRGQQFLTAFRQIVKRLRNDPEIFGEAEYSLPAISLDVRKAIIIPLVVDYGVHRERPLVFIRGFKLLF